MRAIWKWLTGTDAFLRTASGVIHVGANEGQERDDYARHGLQVVWIEPIPAVFSKLQANISGYGQQHAYQYLVTDKDGETYQFHVANNRGESSSILDLGQHAELWPHVHYQESIALSSITLDSLVERQHIDVKKYDVLILDTQGSELLVLKGAERLLSGIRYIRTEAADFELYKDCAQVDEIDAFLRMHGFLEHRRRVQASHHCGGKCYNILYRREPPRIPKG